MKLTVSSLRSVSGEISCFVSVIEDITERKLVELVPDPLTSLELEVLALVLRWQTNPEIARKLAYSQSTIMSHVCSVLMKLGGSSRRQPASVAVDIGLVPAVR